MTSTSLHLGRRSATPSELCGAGAAAPLPTSSRQGIDVYIELGEVPPRLQDPITLEPLRSPIRVSNSAAIYSQRSFQRWFAVTLDPRDPVSRRIISPAHIGRDATTFTEMQRLRLSAELTLRAEGDLHRAYALRWLRLWCERTQRRPLPDLRGLLSTSGMSDETKAQLSSTLDASLGRVLIFTRGCEARSIAGRKRRNMWFGATGLALAGASVGAAWWGKDWATSAAAMSPACVGLITANLLSPCAPPQDEGTAGKIMRFAGLCTLAGGAILRARQSLAAWGGLETLLSFGVMYGLSLGAGLFLARVELEMRLYQEAFEMLESSEELGASIDPVLDLAQVLNLHSQTIAEVTDFRLRPNAGRWRRAAAERPPLAAAVYPNSPAQL